MMTGDQTSQIFADEILRAEYFRRQDVAARRG